ncbi:Vacuolar protein sorting-associated protein 11 [Thecaphora frezii]
MSKRATESVELGAAAAAPAWRSFSFFDPTQLRDAHDFARSPHAFRNPYQIAHTALSPIRPPPLALASDQPDDPASIAGPSTQAHIPAPSHLRQPCLLVGTIDGQIQALDPETYVQLASWQAFSSQGASGRVTHLSCDARGRLVSLGEEDSSRFPILRIWDMRIGRLVEDGRQWVPKLLSEGKVQHGSRPHPIATVAHTASLSFLSVALGDGTVLLIRGLDAALMAAASSSAGLATNASSRPAAAIALPKFKVVYQPSANDSSAHEPVTALGFSETSSAVVQHANAATPATKPTSAGQEARARKGLGPLPRQRSKLATAAGVANTAEADMSASDASPVSMHLFIVTLSRILRYIVVGKGAGSSPAILDDVGCALGCAAVIPSRRGRRLGGQAGGLSGKMVVAREEAIYVIGPEGREACYAYEGPKSSIHLSSSQVIIVTPPFTPSSSSASATVRNFVAGRDHAPPPFTPSSSAHRGSPLSSASPLQRRGLAPSEIAKVTVFDLDNKFVAYSGTFEGGVRETWVGPSGEVMVLGDSGSLTRLDEKPLHLKLEILYRKSLYLLAVNLARSHAERAGTPEALARVEALMADIFQRYGDHLYNKGDFEGAMAQYVKTIGHTQPSFVIRKFLDAQRIANLTTYLQELHARGMASSDHTTLLLNCYTKLKDVASLDRFIKRPPTDQRGDGPGSPNIDGDGADGLAGDNERDELPFDLETAMRVCRQAGYHGHAAYLARRYGEHDEYLKIQIEDANDFEDALAYMRGLAPEEAIRNMTQYGKLLLDQLPEKTTDLLIELCAGAFRPTTATGLGQANPSRDGAGKSAAAAYLSYLHVGAFNKSLNATDGGNGNSNGISTGPGTGASTPILNQTSTSNRNSFIATIDPYNVEGTRSRRQSVLPNVDEGTLGEATEEAYAVPSPRTFFAHFIQHPAEFIRFLETVALARWGQSVNMDLHAESHDPLSLKAPIAEDAEDEVTLALRELGVSTNDDYEDADDRDQKAIWNTLLELYLSSSKPVRDGESNAFGLDGAQRCQRREKALHLLEQHETLPYDVSHALMLCSVEEFTEGLVLLYERMGMYEDVLRFWMDASLDEDADNRVQGEVVSCKVMAALRRYGDAKPHLYPIVMRYLVSSDEILSRHHEDLGEVLDYIEEHALLSPLEVVQALSRTGVASVGLVRSYLTRTIVREREEIEANEATMASLQSSTAAKLAEMHALTTAERPQVFQMTRCSACGGQLDLPTVHFMCKHSFHQRCLGENETECLVCAQRIGAMRDWRREVEMLNGRSDLFEAELETAKDGFQTISMFFSKGLMALAASAQLS